MKRAREAYPEKYAAAIARKRARMATAPAVKAEVARQLRANSDIKYTDVSSNYANANTNTITSATVNLTRGTAGLDNFLGNHITPVGFQGKFTLTSASVGTFNVVRVLVFQWFDASVPTISGILQAYSPPLNTLSPPLVTNKNQMRVLYDKAFYMSPTASDATTTPTGLGGVTGKFYIPGNRLKKLKFNSGSNAVQDGGIYVAYLSDDATVPQPQGAAYHRLAFMDS